MKRAGTDGRGWVRRTRLITAFRGRDSRGGPCGVRDLMDVQHRSRRSVTP